MFENDALYKILKNKVQMSTPYYQELNHLIAQTMSSFTQSIRFDGESSATIADLTTNLSNN